MVAAEKMARAQAETRLRQAEENLAAAEAAMRDMQHHLQSLPTLLPAADVRTTKAARERTYNTSHVPHVEFIAFIHHLRTHKPRKPEHLALFPPPTLASLLAQPFLARAEREDVDPSLRLDTAPDLSWLTRRSVMQAILAGDLVIEPVSVNTLRQGKEYASVHPADIACSMCGKHVVKPTATHESSSYVPPPPPPPPSTKLASTPGGGGGGRNASTSRFSFKPFFSSPSATPSPSASPVPSSTTPTPRRPPPTTLFIFRITSADNASDASRMYPLCANGWCLARLRAVCEWWRFVRVCMVDVIWRGDDGHTHVTRSMGGGSKRPSMNGTLSAPMTPTVESIQVETEGQPAAPDLPPRKSGWSLGFKGLGGGRGLGLSKPGSPTASPGERTQEEVGLGQPEVAVETGPVEADGDDVKTESETEARPEIGNGDAATALDGPRNPDAQEDTLPTSSAASESSEPVNGFSTPQSTSAPLSPAQPEGGLTDKAPDSHPADESSTPEPAAVESATPDAAEQSIDLSSPRIEPTESAEPQTPSTPSASASISAPTPTPTPPRPARRAVPVLPTAPAVPERSRARPTSLTLDPKPETTPTTSEQVPITPDPTTASQPAVVTPVPTRAPLLPARTDKRGSVAENREDTGAEGEGEVDSWEGKTWREVVRLKEEMWKARVGVRDAEAQ